MAAARFYGFYNLIYELFLEFPYFWEYGCSQIITESRHLFR